MIKIIRFILVFAIATTSAKAQFTISAVGQTDVCFGPITLVVDNPQPNYTYNWFVGSYACTGGSGSPLPYGTPGPTLLAYGTGEFFCIGTDINGAALFSNPVTVRIHAGSIGSLLLPLPYSQSPVNCLASVPLCIPSVFYATFPNTVIKWYKNNVIINGATTSSYNATTSGYYKYSISSGACLSNFSDSVLVNTPPANPIITSLPSPVCVGAVVNFSISNPVPGSTYLWELSQAGGVYNPIGTGTTINYTIPPIGFIIMRAKITNSGCNQTSNLLTLQIQNLNLAISPSSNFSICSGTTASFVATSIVPSPVYQWFFNGSPIPGANASSYNTSVAGAYSVSLTYTCGTIATNPVNMAVNTLPTATATAAGPTTFCSGGNVNLNANTGIGLVYQWKKYANNVVGANGPSLNVTTTGKYKVVVTNAAGCSKSSNSIDVTVNPLPTSVITYVGTTNICAGDSVQLIANSGAGFTYQWKKYSNNIAGAVASNYYAKTTGKYKCTVTNSNGCSRASNSITVNVVCREGLISNADSEIKVFPNPSTGIFTVSLPENVDRQSECYVTDMIGRVMKIKIDWKADNELEVQGLNQGIFMLHVVIDDIEFVKTVIVD
jgi:hypothetical protein